MAELETRQLRLVAALAQTRSVTKAAALLRLTQPAVSHGLKTLEGQVGVPLFLRGRRGLRPTEAGDRLLRSAHAILKELSGLDREIREQSLGRGALIRLGTECYTAYHWLPAVLADAARELPRVEVRAIPGVTGNPLLALQREEIEVAITVRNPSGIAFEIHQLFEDELVVVLDPDHPRRTRPWFDPDDFAGEHLLRFTERPEDTTVIRELLAPAGVAPLEQSYVPAIEALVEMVKAGIGIAVLARWAVAPALEQKALMAVPLTRSGWRRTWSAAVRPDGVHLGTLRKLVQLLRRNGPEFTRPVRRRRLMPARRPA